MVFVEYRIWVSRSTGHGKLDNVDLKKARVNSFKAIWKGATGSRIPQN